MYDINCPTCGTEEVEIVESGNQKQVYIQGHEFIVHMECTLGCREWEATCVIMEIDTSYVDGNGQIKDHTTK